MRISSRTLALIVGLALTAAGTPLAADPCGGEARCPMMAASSATHSCCPVAPSLSSLAACCSTATAPATAPVEVRFDAPAAATPGFDSAQLDTVDLAPPVSPFLSAALARAELRHELGLFVLFAAFLN